MFTCAKKQRTTFKISIFETWELVDFVINTMKILAPLSVNDAVPFFIFRWAKCHDEDDDFHDLLGDEISFP